MSTDLALRGALPHETPGSMRHQSKVRITGLTIKRGFVFENEHIIPGERSMLSDSQCASPGSVEFPNAQRLPRFVIPDVVARRKLKRVIIGLTGRPSILLVVVSIFVEELAEHGVDSPPSSIGNREPSGDNDRAYVPGVVDVAIPIDDLEHLSPRIALKSTKVLVHVLPVGERTLQGESNRLCGYETHCSVNNDNVEIQFMWIVYIVPMCLFEVVIESSEVLEHRNAVIVSIFVGIGWQIPVIEGVWVERIGSRRFLVVEFLPCVDILVFAI